MIKRVSAAMIAIVAIAITNPVSAGNSISDGMCTTGARITFGQFTGTVQCNYKHKAIPNHAKINGNELTLTAYTCDEPHTYKPPGVTNGANPRAEISLDSKFYYTRNNIATWSSKVWIDSKSKDPFSFVQIYNIERGGNTRATSVML